MIRSSLLFIPLLAACGSAMAHDGPDPVMHWIFDERHVADGKVTAQLGPDARLSGSARLVTDALGQSLVFKRGMDCTVADDLQALTDLLPQTALTVAAWVAVDEPAQWGGIVGTIQDNGGHEKGWLLGHNQSVFTFALSTQGADDGDGKLTYLQGKTRWEPGRLYHVVVVYNGSRTELFVNGTLDASTADQWGDILYPERAPFVIGAYRDDDELHRFRGRLRDVRVFDIAARPAWVEQDFEHQQQLTALEARLGVSSTGFAIPPYLQFGTQTGMTVMWRTSVPATSTVYYGPTAECEQLITSATPAEIHELRIESLQPETQYFYLVESETADGQVIESEVRTFTTAVMESTPFAFAVISDTQGNPRVSGTIAQMAWDMRPSFLLHPGDLVDAGKNKTHWTEHFFPGMRPLIERVPFYPVLGNHEQNAKNYFDYMSLPAPEYYYQFRYGNAEFFMIDSNRNIDPSSEQYAWLDNALGNSSAVWKVVCHHHPPYSSDENDYGNLWETNTSSRGDLRARQLVTLYDQHHVDLVWNGHIHSYERTWPLRNQAAVDGDGTVYMITGGGGGGLETPGPFRPWFQNNVRRGHHFCFVAVNGKTMEIKSFDLEGRLFDTVTLRKAE